MDYNIALRMRALIRIMKNNEDIKEAILNTEPTYDGVKGRYSFHTYRPWWYLVWRTYKSKGIYIFLEMVQTRNSEPEGDTGATPWWDMKNGDIWDYICEPTKWFTEVSSQNPPTGSDPLEDNIGPWHTGDD